VSTATWLAVLALVGVAVCAFGWRRSAGRVARLERRVAALEREVHDDVLPTLDLSLRESEEAVYEARRAARVAGIEEPLPRLAAEPFTAPVVRAVAFGAGARRAVARFAGDMAPLGRSRAATRYVNRQWKRRSG
jgi:Flp pilus assembly protein TadB